jgi:hypothetical protein
MVILKALMGWDINFGVMVLFDDDFGVLMVFFVSTFPVNWLYKLSKCHSYSCFNSFLSSSFFYLYLVSGLLI